MKAKTSIILGGLILSGALHILLTVTGQPKAIAATASITLFVAILWVSEALPIPVTSLIPFFAFPLAGVLTHQQAASALGSHVILLLMGAFMLSKSLEKSTVHKRLAVYMLKLTGTHSAKRLVLGFMLTAALLSMWISNTATTLMLLPIALALIPLINNQRTVLALLLGIAYAASLGGVGTPIGTPPNIIFMSVYSETQGQEIDFLEWMKTGIPVVVIAIPLMALWLTRGLGKLEDCHMPAAGQWQSAEKRVLWVFAGVALAWVLRPYWTGWLNMPYVGDSSIALLGVVIMFLVPSGNKDQSGKDETLLDWNTAASIPWGMLLLFAGGICIAKAFSASGLSEVMGGWLTGLSTLPLPVLILSVCLFVTFLTEITSNTATATLLMPILATAGAAANIDPALLMMPAAMSASCAFMLPVATAPNAIIYGTGKFAIKQMAREGFALNIIAALVITAVTIVTI
ncbi:SLC13 family permease [Aliiglaciecola sp. LCG003]|uniref:SLC13 family permease n=1 Tax=Aliiglaciecola sp. LCG003 TaxID=3053655 RepID=UPI0025724B30|nr:SLC13 family permease [Aliiglaciecola sp. LCG003]WJG07942.1 SLC13 family permease [Aliiglaciecola sp. LCG003]